MNIVQALAMLRRSPLRTPSATEDLASLWPAIIPAAWLDGSAWTPGFRLPAGEIAVTWMLKRDLPTYPAAERTAEWEAAGIDWRRQAFRNLQSGSGAVVDEGRDGQGELLWLSLRDADGSGGARALLQRQLARQFPGGYRLAVPEPSTGYAVAARLAGAELDAVKSRILDLHAGAAIPISPALWSPEDLAVPANWLE